MKPAILVIEDDPIDLISIKAKLGELGHASPIMVDHKADYTALLQNSHIELVIADIYYDKEPLGLSLIETCRLYKVPLILMTADTRFSTFNLANRWDKVAYMVKPFHYLTLQTCIDMVMANFNSYTTHNDKYIFVNDYDNKKIKLHHKDILFLESEGNTCYIQSTKKRYMLRTSLGKISNELKDFFIQVHKSFIVNIAHVNRVSGNQLTIDLQHIPIGRKYRKELLKSLPSIKK